MPPGCNLAAAMPLLDFEAATLAERRLFVESVAREPAALPIDGQMHAEKEWVSRCLSPGEHRHGSCTWISLSFLNLESNSQCVQWIEDGLAGGGGSMVRLCAPPTPIKLLINPKDATNLMRDGSSLAPVTRALQQIRTYEAGKPTDVRAGQSRCTNSTTQSTS